MLEQRRLQKLGNSTLMVSLPKEWADGLKLKKGDVVSISTDDQGRLVIHPSLKEPSTRTRAVITADKIDGPLLERLLLGAYVQGHDTILVRSSSALTTEHLASIRKTLNDLIGVGLVEQDEKKVLISSFLDPSKFPVDGLILRLYLIVESMVDLAVDALTERENELADQVISMDAEADKIYFLGVRQLIQALDDKALAEKLDLTRPQRIIRDRLILRSLEEVGDHAQIIARCAKVINEDFHNKSLNAGIVALREHVRKIAALTMDAMTKVDPRLANSAIVEYGLLAELEEKQLVSALDDKHEPPVPPLIMSEFKAISQSLKQIGKYYVNSAEVVINRAVADSTAMVEVIRTGAD